MEEDCEAKFHDAWSLRIGCPDGWYLPASHVLAAIISGQNVQIAHWFVRLMKERYLGKFPSLPCYKETISSMWSPATSSRMSSTMNPVARSARDMYRQNAFYNWLFFDKMNNNEYAMKKSIKGMVRGGSPIDSVLIRPSTSISINSRGGMKCRLLEDSGAILLLHSYRPGK